jgi:hypothetical protein
LVSVSEFGLDILDLVVLDAISQESLFGGDGSLWMGVVQSENVGVVFMFAACKL